MSESAPTDATKTTKEGAATEEDPSFSTPLHPLASHFSRLSRERIYLNAAGRSPMPARTLSVGLAAVRRKAETPWSIGDTDADREVIRELFGAMIGADARDITTAPSCSYAMTLAANNLRHKLTGGRSR